ncbi:MAG: amidohydrolase family protein, partial [Promethearchaeota archaeon]
MLGIEDDWLPPGFEGWKYDGGIHDSHVHVNAATSTLSLFCTVAKSFGIKHVGAIVRGFSWFDELPDPTITHHFLPFLWYHRGKGVIDINLLDDMKENGARGIKFWFASRYFEGRKRIDTEELASFLREAGKRDLVVTAHVSDPDAWHARMYPAKQYGTKDEMREQMIWLVEQAPETTFVLVHMAGKPEDPTHLAELLDSHDNLYIDTSATKWVSRELSFHFDDALALFKSYPDRILF